jgi:hypothetical protein
MSRQPDLQGLFGLCLRRPNVTAVKRRGDTSATADGKAADEAEVLLSPSAGGPGKLLAAQIDSNMLRAIWMPDGKSLLVGANDAISALWLRPSGGPAWRLATGDVSPPSPFGLGIAAKRVIRMAPSHKYAHCMVVRQDVEALLHAFERHHVPIWNPWETERLISLYAKKTVLISHERS